MTRVYRKKHFYEVTWTNDDGWCPEVCEDYLFCIIGYRKPTNEEAEKFLKNKMDEWGYNTVSSVREISKEEALRDFNMSGWQNMKVFGADDLSLIKLNYFVKESVLDCKKIDTAIERAKKELRKQELHENFGQEYVRAIRDKFGVGLDYSLEGKIQMAKLDSFNHWCSTYVPERNSSSFKEKGR